MASFIKTFKNQYDNVSSETKSNNEVNGVAAVAGMNNTIDPKKIHLIEKRLREIPDPINQVQPVSVIIPQAYEIDNVPNMPVLISPNNNNNNQNEISEVNSVPNQPGSQQPNNNQNIISEVNRVPNQPGSQQPNNNQNIISEVNRVPNQPGSQQPNNNQNEISEVNSVPNQPGSQQPNNNQNIISEVNRVPNQPGSQQPNNNQNIISEVNRVPNQPGSQQPNNNQNEISEMNSVPNQLGSQQPNNNQNIISEVNSVPNQPGSQQPNNNQNEISEMNSVPNQLGSQQPNNNQNIISEVNSVPNRPLPLIQNRNTHREVNRVSNKPKPINNINPQPILPEITHGHDGDEGKTSLEKDNNKRINLHTKNIFSQVLLYFELCLNKILFIIKNNNYNNEKSLLDNIINIESNFVEKINNNYKLQQDTITYVDQHQPSVFSLKEKLKIILCAFMHLAPNKICLIKNFNTQTMYHENEEVKNLLDNSEDPSIADLIISLGDLVYYAVQECKKTFGINEDKMKICSKLNNEMIYPITKYNVHEKFIILVSNYDTISMYKLLIIYVMHNNFPESS